jgi:hypothetical protein
MPDRPTFPFTIEEMPPHSLEHLCRELEREVASEHPGSAEHIRKRILLADTRAELARRRAARHW